MGDQREPVVWRVPSRAQRTIRAGGCVTGPAPMWSYPETDPKDPEAVALYAHPPETEALVDALRGLNRNRHGDVLCFCDMAIGNPMVTRHSAACDRARRALEAYEGGQSDEG